jgi:hypothetical protein
MVTRLKTFVVAAVLAAGVPAAAMAEYHCAPGYALHRGVCQPIRSPGYSSPGYSNPVSGAASGLQAGAAQGHATAGPVGALLGGAAGTATGTVAGTANMLTGH